jgi:hypothetical protein
VPRPSFPGAGTPIKRRRVPLAPAADGEMGLQLLNLILIARRSYGPWSLGSIGPDLGLFCRARPQGQRLVCFLAPADTCGKTIGTGLL